MANLEEFSTLTSKGQTTLPKAVRQALRLHAGDKLRFRVEGDAVLLERADAADDPAMLAFLDFLARDITARPEQLQALSPALKARLDALTAGIDDSPDQTIEGDVAL